MSTKRRCRGLARKVELVEEVRFTTAHTRHCAELLRELHGVRMVELR